MNKKVIIVILVIAVVVGVLFALTRKRYVFDFEGRVKALETVSKIQKKYPNATVLIPDDSTQLPKTVPIELTYAKSKVASFEQLGSQGISFILISSDSRDVISKTMSRAMESAGWELISKSEDTIEAKKGVQKTKIFLEKEEDHTLIVVAYTYNL